MLVYAVPKLELGGPWNVANVFGLVWTVFALVVIAAHFNALLLMSEEKRKEIERIRRQKKRMWERRLEKSVSGSSRSRARG
ncbi:hypothetical protein [Paenibacillus sp. NEAU-GSW1]|uniref:hypothetical protein n=1 Tax=Paenibacillus sp. NEAU-GSW1 TaxID=2682486 RepID=UPI0020A64FD9|nr:hypothetical protein [Paenibacillus sp. NEAU-GSW1]